MNRMSRTRLVWQNQLGGKCSGSLKKSYKRLEENCAGLVDQLVTALEQNLIK